MTTQQSFVYHPPVRRLESVRAGMRPWSKSLDHVVSTLRIALIIFERRRLFRMTGMTFSEKAVRSEFAAKVAESVPPGGYVQSSVGHARHRTCAENAYESQIMPIVRNQ